jgi:hypothetical protein
MPTSVEIVERLAAIAQGARPVAIAWHALIGLAVLALAMGWRPATRLAKALLLLPLVSVVVLAFAWANPVNGVVLGAGAIALAMIASAGSSHDVRAAPPLALAIGGGLLVFGWAYPHFVDPGANWYAAPLGTLPCPTLSVLIGGTIAGGGLRSARWSATLAALGLLYGLVGALWLGVWIDLVLVGGAAVLQVQAWGLRASRALLW